MNRIKQNNQKLLEFVYAYWTSATLNKIYFKEINRKAIEIRNIMKKIALTLYPYNKVTIVENSYEEVKRWQRKNKLIN